MLPQLKEEGAFARSWIGVKIQPLTEALAQSYGIKLKQGALVAEVVPKSPAANAGLQEGDIIQEFDGKPVRQSSDLPLYASMAGVGKKVEVKVWRDNKDKMVALTLGKFPGDKAPVPNKSAEGEELGMGIVDVTPDMQQQLGLSESVGAVVTQVLPGSPAARAGIQPGDVITSINGSDTPNAEAILAALRKAAKGSVLRVKSPVRMGDCSRPFANRNGVGCQRHSA